VSPRADQPNPQLTHLALSIASYAAIRTALRASWTRSTRHNIKWEVAGEVGP